MIKLISIILSLALVACMFAMNVGAAKVVGNHGATGSVNDGDTDIPANSSLSSNVTLTVGTVNHRYAVDVTFQTMAINAGDVTWNVTTAKYELANVVTATSWDITVVNYSDMEVTATADITETNLKGGMTVAFDGANSLPLNAVTVGDTEGESGTMTVKASSTDWNETINAYIKASELTDVKIAKITVTITKTNP